MEKIKPILCRDHVTVLKHIREREGILDNIYERYNITLPDDYEFNRNKVHDDKVFIDTNLLVYHISNQEKNKRKAKETFLSSKETFISSQVISDTKLRS